VFWLTAVILVVDTAAYAWSSGGPLLGLAALVFFPLTFFASPFVGGSVALFVVSLAAYAGSTMLGAPPVD
jgi:hypothetical protein